MPQWRNQQMAVVVRITIEDHDVDAPRATTSNCRSAEEAASYLAAARQRKQPGPHSAAMLLVPAVALQAIRRQSHIPAAMAPKAGLNSLNCHARMSHLLLTLVNNRDQSPTLVFFGGRIQIAAASPKIKHHGQDYHEHKQYETHGDLKPATAPARSNNSDFGECEPTGTV